MAKIIPKHQYESRYRNYIGKYIHAVYPEKAGTMSILSMPSVVPHT